MRLEGKVAVITGGTRGIGRASVERFGEEGARVVFSGRNADEGKELERSWRDRGLEVWYVRADSAVQADVRDLIGAAITHGGRLDVLINNAAAVDLARPGGVDGLEDKPIHEVSDEAIDLTIGVGLYGVLWACRYAVREMLKSNSGSIINISSVAARLGVPGVPIYSASKGALNALTRQMAADYGRLGIRSNAVIVGLVPTPEQTAAGHIPLPIAEPLDIANALLFLASDEARYVSGAILAVDGAMTSVFGPAMQGWD